MLRKNKYLILSFIVPVITYIFIFLLKLHLNDSLPSLTVGNSKYVFNLDKI
jgi:hypothetical protein